MKLWNIFNAFFYSFPQLTSSLIDVQFEYCLVRWMMKKLTLSFFNKSEYPVFCESPFGCQYAKDLAWSSASNFLWSVKNMCRVSGGKKFQNLVFRKMDEEDSLDGMDDEESKNPLAFLGLQRFTINARKSLLYLLLFLQLNLFLHWVRHHRHKTILYI